LYFLTLKFSEKAMKKIINILVIAFAVLLFAPFTTVAQDVAKVPRVGVIMTGGPKTHAAVVKELRQGLRELGYVEGRNIILEPRFAMGKRARLPKLAEELLQLKVDVIVVTGARAAKMTRKASPSIPIVVASAGDLVGSGVVASLARPGGNTTGNTAYSMALGGKQLELLKEAIPRIARVAVLYSAVPGNKTSVFFLKSVEVAGRALDVEIQGVGVRDAGEFEGAFAAMAKARADALILTVTRLTSVYRKELIKLAAKSKLPAMGWRPSMARAGCLLSYGANRKVMYRRAATFVHKILEGAKPADLPVEQPTKFDLVINLKTAKALGITLPPSILFQAAEVIK
jgi:putative ABC transport system substrate-binding protein